MKINPSVAYFHNFRNNVMITGDLSVAQLPLWTRLYLRTSSVIDNKDSDADRGYLTFYLVQDVVN